MQAQHGCCRVRKPTYTYDSYAAYFESKTVTLLEKNGLKLRMEGDADDLKARENDPWFWCCIELN